jgi:putative glutamine amidotransferase
MIVFVSMRSADSATYREARDGLSHDWSRWCDALGILPVPVPNALQRPEAFFDEVPGRGLLLTGGDDLGDAPRDRTESRLLAAALARRMPVFGVCRGLQVIATAFGAPLCRAVAGHVATVHAVEIVDGLNGALPIGRIAVNSFHNDAVRVADLAGGLKAFAVSPEGWAEGLYHPEWPVTAVQWHPERDNPGRGSDARLLQRWIAQCE